MFVPFKGLLWEARRLGERSSEKLENRLIELTAFMQARNQGQSAMAQSALFELVHYWLSHRVLYVSTPLAQQLMETRIEVPPGDLAIPYRLFELCVDEKLDILGGKGSSALVVVAPDDALMSAVLRRLQQTADYAVDMLRRAGRVVEPASVHIEDGIRRSMRVLFKSEVEPEGIVQVVIKLDGTKTLDELIDTATRFGPTASVDAEVSKEELLAERRLCRIALGCLCYLSTMKPEVEGWKDRNRPSMAMVRPAGLILGRTMQLEVGWHLRKAHMRFLHDERYKRNEDGSVRSIWVRGAEIHPDRKPGGQKVKAEHLE